MKKPRKTEVLPVNQQDLAAYLGISPTLLSMTQTGRHGLRQLSSSSSKKMTELILAHNRSQKANSQGISLRKIEARFVKDPARLAKKILLDADYAHSRAAALKGRLAELVKKKQEDMHWLNTVDHLLATLPVSKETAGDRLWLENQQVIVLGRLEKNSRLAQAKLVIQIEIEKIKALVYRDLQKSLLKDQ